jgi:hypothetical protein
MKDVIYLTPVQVVRVETTKENEDGQVFNQMVLAQDMMVPTNSGGSKFMTRELKIITSWDEAKCLSKVKNIIPGNIIRQECAAYKWVDPDGVEHELTHKYVLG